MSRSAVRMAVMLLLATSLGHADVVALKRSPGLAIDAGLDAAFKTAIANGTVTLITGADAAIDADMWTNLSWATANCWRNTGTNGAIRSDSPLLSKFKVSALPNFAGSRINKAQLRFYYGAGNNGFDTTGYITSFDWAEGNKGGTAGANTDGDFPGKAPAAAGVCYAHPKGLNTSNNQDAGGGTTGPIKSWAGNDYFSPLKDCSSLTAGCTRTSYASNLPNGTNPPYDGFEVIDVTQIVQAWANGVPNYGFCTVKSYTDFTGNYSIALSETAVSAEVQPVLIIDYQQNAAPNAVTDLAVVSTDWYKVDLRWTAPADSPPGPVTSYDLRYSTSPIDDGNWAAATPCGCALPTPAAPGTVQTVTIRNLSPSVTYYFALKSADITGLVSPLSNVVSPTTLPKDVVAPEAAADLVATSIKPNYVVLTWTAVGDDGNVGVAASYDLRYSTSLINESNWDAATPVATPAPKVAGSAETFTVHGLVSGTTYYVAMKVADEVPNVSAISNVAVFTTLPADLLAPTTVTDLRVTAVQINVAYLSWSAPADTGSAGMAGYDLRYSTSPIDESNWAGAAHVTNEPVPAAAGTKEYATVTGLQPDTTYYFAIKSFDYAEPANVSGLSNVPSGRTLPPVPPVTVRNPWIVNDRVANTYSVQTMGQTYINAYTPDGVVPPANDEAKAINLYNNQKRRLYHWADVPPSPDDPSINQNVFGWALCGQHQNQATSIATAGGITSRKIGINQPPYGGHNFYEVQYNGTWHMFDTMTTAYVYNRANPRSVASCSEIAADATLMTSAIAEGRGCPGFLLCGDDAVWFAAGIRNYTNFGAGNSGSLVMNQDLHIGEVLTRTWESWTNQHPTPKTGTPPNPPFHHEAAADWKDTVNYPYWEPYYLDAAGNSAIGISYSKTYRRWANGTYVLTPDFHSQAYQAMLDASSHDIATSFQDNLTPDLHAATVGTTAEAVFKINIPFYITDANISGTFLKTNAADVCRISISTNGTNWTQIWDDTAIGTTQLTNYSLRGSVFGAMYTYYIKVQIKATGAKSDAGVSNLVITTIFEHNKGAMAYLDKGVNHLTVTLDNPQDLGSNVVFKITYKWKEYDGTGWNVDRSQELYVSSSPATFTINVGGTKVPRTESIKMEITTPPPPDLYPPAAVTTLAAGPIQATKVGLTWTAVGDDDMTGGPATSYELRYSTSPISDANFGSATLVTGVPAPAMPLTQESFTVAGLQPDTTYYFSIKARDEGGNIGQFGNVVTARTLPPDLTPPGRVYNLRARMSKAGRSVDLTWKAVADDGYEGVAAKSCDLRYSTSEITDATWAAASRIGSLAAPKAPGSAESITVGNLVAGTMYYFAMKVTDEAGNVSAMSNVGYAPASGLGELTLQRGLSGYFGIKDCYMYAGAATTNYGTQSIMRACAYGSLGLTNIQRPLLSFDVTNIPAGTPILSAKLMLYSATLGQIKGTSGAYGLYPVTKNWTESGACWSNSASGAAWTTAGGDFSAAADTTTLRHSPVECSWYTFDVTSRVQAWINSPAGNYGWVVKALDEMASIQDEFASSDYGTADLRPKLIVSDMPTLVVCDINQDGGVDVVDLLYLVESFGTAAGDDGYDLQCDFNDDESVDVVDLLTLVENWPEG